MKLYFRYMGILLKGQMQHKASFVMMTLGQFLVSFTTFLGVYFLMDRFHSVNDFSFSEVLLCFSVVLMAFSLAECFFRGFDRFPNLIRTGQLDRILVRPRNEMFQVLISNLDISRLGRVFQAVLMLGYAIPASGIHWTADKILGLTLMILGGIAVFTGLFILYAGISFFTLEGLEFMNIFLDGSREFGKYPLSIYGEGVLKLCTYVIPIALFQYYPLLYLIGRAENIGLILLPLLGFLFILPCYGFFRYGLRKYQSAGS